MADEIIVDATASDRYNVNEKFEIPAGDRLFTVRLPAVIPVGKVVVARMQVRIVIEDVPK